MFICSVLEQAAFFGQMGAVRELLQAIANPNAQDAEGCTPVFLAAQEGHEEVGLLFCSDDEAVEEAIGGRGGREVLFLHIQLYT